MQSFNDYGDCSGPYPWMGGYDCTSSGCTWADGSPWSFVGPGWNRDDPYLHFYTNGNWGTWSAGGQAKGICEYTTSTGFSNKSKHMFLTNLQVLKSFLRSKWENWNFLFKN